MVRTDQLNTGKKRASLFKPLYTAHVTELPTILPNPFINEAHPIAVQAKNEFMATAASEPWFHSLHTPSGGKMFGVLVVRKHDQLGYLVGFSGQLDGQWTVSGFVPPVFDEKTYTSALELGHRRLAELTKELESRKTSDEYVQLQTAFEKSRKEIEHSLELRRIFYRHKKAIRQEKRTEQTIESDTAKNQLFAQLARESQADKRHWKLERADLLQTLEVERSHLATVEGSINTLERQRKQVAQSVQKKLFDTYELANLSGHRESLLTIWARYCAALGVVQGNAAGDGLPSSGTGDCAAPKLLNTAAREGYDPVALAEFWIGHPNRSEVRQHGRFYPPCRGRCAAILPWMMDDSVNNAEVIRTVPVLKSLSLELPILDQDDHIAVIEKPAGLLSVPGRYEQDSVYSRLRTQFPKWTGPLVVHRLDLDTSGIMLVAKHADAYKRLQHQFMQRSIEKRYIAILSSSVAAFDAEQTVNINLPLRVDIDDRPRQLVCDLYGKPSQTQFTVQDRASQFTRVIARPVTGRTHQIRLHAAHQRGLGASIVGDPLYATVESSSGSGRMLLHAESVTFNDPYTEEVRCYSSATPF